jgi:uncharacterized protein (TIGR02453 family)
VRYFTEELFSFLRKLKRNNRREWFLDHKDEYLQFVRDPFLSFISDIGPHLRRIHPRAIADPHPTRGSLFRIYRDTRFSADKTPYKTHVAAQFCTAPRATPGRPQSDEILAGKKYVHLPGFYLHFEPDNCFVAAGLWHPEAAELNRVRAQIAESSSDWKRARRGLELEGDSLSRPPRGFAADHPLIEDIKRKDFIASVEFSERTVCGSAFARDFLAASRRLMPMLSFLISAVDADGSQSNPRIEGREAVATQRRVV